MNNRLFTSCSLRFKPGAGDGNRTRVLSLRLRLVAKTPASTAKEEIPGILRHQPDIANCDMCEVGTPRGQPV